MSVVETPVVERLDISTQNVRPGSPHLPIPLSEEAFVHLTEEHILVLQWFFHLVIRKAPKGFAGSPADFARQLWELEDAHCD